LSTVLERAKKVPCLEPRRLRAYRERLFVELEKRRQTALALIMDDVQYPYPYAPDQAKVQAEVDRLAGEVRALWASPGGELLEKDGDLVGLREEIRHLTSLLGSSEGPDPEKALLDHVDAAIDMRHYDGNGSGIIDHWASVSAHNDSILAAGEMSQHERDCYTATNEYRVMMGLKAVMADPKLVQCARGHSIEMHELNYFSHTSPTEGRRSPGDRAQLAGWGGSVSENIARGSEDGFGVVVQWCHSSGHHRNILGRRWTHLGVGRAPEAAFWTQNFATGRAKPPKK
jgi:uncharacterized protein YkwD